MKKYGALLTTEQDYRALQRELHTVEEKFSVILTDELIDRENSLVNGITEDHADFWPIMNMAQQALAVIRAEEAGIDINNEVSWIIH